MRKQIKRKQRKGNNIKKEIQMMNIHNMSIRVIQVLKKMNQMKKIWMDIIQMLYNKK